jgi:hypothetical protein
VISRRAALELAEDEMYRRLVDEQERRKIPSHTLVRMVEVLRRAEAGSEPAPAPRQPRSATDIVDGSRLPPERREALLADPEASL